MGRSTARAIGSKFDISTGAPTSSSQARSPLPAKTTTVSGDSVYVH